MDFDHSTKRALTGQLDDNGVEIVEGDIIEHTVLTHSYRETHSEDGWGRSRTLAPCERYDVPSETTVSRGIVVYSPLRSGFVVKWADRWPRQDDLYMVQGASSRWLGKELRRVVVGKADNLGDPLQAAEVE